MVNALNRLGVDPVLTDDQEELSTSDKVIFPGVGEASTAMNHLREQNIVEVIRELKQPFLGVCLGLQLMCKHSEENDTDCLGVFDIEVKKFQPKLKVPHIGWNKIAPSSSPLFYGIENGAYFYFVHSYYAAINTATIGVCNYVNDFSAVLHQENFYAIQAHPEKSGDDGAKFLSNFLSL